MRLLTFLFIIALSFTSVFAQNKSNDSEATKQLYKLFDETWEQNLKDNPTFASTLGDKRYNDKWGDYSIAAFEKRHKEDIATLAKINKIDRKQLSISDQLNYDLFKKDYEQSIESFKFKTYLLPINQRGGIQTQNNLANSLQFNEAKDYYDWLKRLKAFPEQMEQTIARMKEGKRLKIMWAKKVLERVPNQIDSQIVENPEKSPFYKPFTKFPDSVSESDQKEIITSAKLTIENVIIPEYKKLKKFFENEYLPAAYPNAGIWQHPMGEEYYSYLARSFTTTNMAPKEIHEKGLSEVKRIRAEMEKIKTKVGFKGDLKAFFDYLRTDPKFFYKTPEELLNGYRAIAKRIDPEVPKVIKTMPRMPYGVIPIPDQIAPDTTTAYYNRPAADGSRPGYYFVNLYKPETRPKWEMMALSIHEAVPGHHTQIALQQELGETPNFRKFGGYTAFTEGWGLYSESLGEDMGLYDDPYDKFGQLTYEMWRAIRLVVDTGMHYFKWDRQRAIDFFAANAPKTEQDIVNEIDRYISMPGQALAYKIGELKMQELRRKATKELGDKFDLREFHDVVLLSGAVPLDILERNVNEWIAGQKDIARKTEIVNELTPISPKSLSFNQFFNTFPKSKYSKIKVDVKIKKVILLDNSKGVAIFIETNSNELVYENIGGINKANIHVYGQITSEDKKNDRYFRESFVDLASENEILNGVEKNVRLRKIFKLNKGRYKLSVLYRDNFDKGKKIVEFEIT